MSLRYEEDMKNTAIQSVSSPLLPKRLLNCSLAISASA